MRGRQFSSWVATRQPTALSSSESVHLHFAQLIRAQWRLLFGNSTVATLEDGKRSLRRAEEEVVVVGGGGWFCGGKEGNEGHLRTEFPEFRISNGAIQIPAGKNFPEFR
jgi:hypothetical protein